MMMLQDTPQSFLFVPATRPERIPKAFQCGRRGTDAVIIDWEDSVTDDQRAIARQNTLEYDRSISEDNPHSYWLRINSVDDPAFQDDLKAAAALVHVEGVFLPKVESASDITHIHTQLGKPVIAMIESARALHDIHEIARAEGLYTLTYGRLDFANDLGADVHHPVSEILFDRLRIDLLIHTRVNNLHSPVESIYTDFRDNNGLREYVERWRGLGFGGMLCIHPQQVAIIRDVCKPTDADIAFAHRVVVEHERTQSAAFQLDGKMVDMPVIKWAKKLLREYDEQEV